VEEGEEDKVWLDLAAMLLSVAASRSQVVPKLLRATKGILARNKAPSSFSLHLMSESCEVSQHEFCWFFYIVHLTTRAGVSCSRDLVRHGRDHILSPAPL